MFNNGTLLNNILKDLQPIIIEYIRTYPLFAIGKYDVTYEGYRLVNKSDKDNPNFMKLFMDGYWVNKGLYSLDDSDGDVLSINGYVLGIGIFSDEKCLSTGYIYDNRGWHYREIKKKEIIPLYTYFGDVLVKIDYVKCFWKHKDTKIGLFVKNDFIMSN